jgi:predicted Zn-dependent peptidase
VFVLGALHPAGIPAQDVIDASAEIIGRLADGGPSDAELARAQARFSANLFRESDATIARTRDLGLFELLHGRAELLGELPVIAQQIDPEAVAAAARSLDPQRCAVLRVVPGGQQ